MNWYSIKMIFQIKNNNRTYVQFDEQIRLVQAISKELALEIGNQIGFMAQEDLVTKDGELLQWKFIAVTEIEHIGLIEHGKEIAYHINEPDNIDSYLQRVNEKAINLKRITQHHFIDI